MPQGNGLPTPDRKEAQRRKTDATKGKNPEKTDEKSTEKPRNESITSGDDNGAKKPAAKQARGQQSMSNFVASVETLETKAFYEGPIMGIKKEFRELPKSMAKLPPFKENELYGEEPTKCHQMMMSAGTVLNLGPKLDTVQKWSDTFDRCFDMSYEGYNKAVSKRLRNLAVRLAKSDPYIMFDKGYWSQGKLVKSDGPCAWMAAYKRFGADWKDRDQFSPF